jgi:hypothetical protein
MPTTLSTTTIISGIVRNNVASLNSYPKVEINLHVGNSKTRFDYGEFDFYGRDIQPNSTAPVPSSNIKNSIGIKEKIVSVNFFGTYPKPETVVIDQALDLNVVDSQNYVTVVEEIEVQGPYWS